MQPLSVVTHLGHIELKLALIGCSSEVDRLYKPCEIYSQELIWCNFKLSQSVWGHHEISDLAEIMHKPVKLRVPNGFQNRALYLQCAPVRDLHFY